MKLLFIFASLFFVPCWALESNLTVAIAARLSYPTTLAGLRNKVENFLDELKVSMMLDVQSLRSQDLAYRAAGLAATDKEIYYTIANRFDREFERLSRKFILRAARLDELDVSVKEKEQFIKSIKSELEASINALLKSYKPRLEIKKQNS